ncbi:MAG TPA: SRPBCC family protein [Burkholderiaceae bacterium]|nr:SRPBCC family protein [Burkholderiaceae bacterium]
MLKTLAIVVAVLIGAVLAYAATRPDELRVERTLAIKAPPEKIFPYVNDLKAWAAWSPYEKKDPAMARTFGSVSAGKGAVYEWNGNSNVGQGRMEITESTASSKIAIKLDFIKPFEGHNVATFAFEPKGETTQVSWTMTGPSAYVTKVMGVFFDMDKMIGDDFAVGLANLKAQAEK